MGVFVFTLYVRKVSDLWAGKGGTGISGALEITLKVWFFATTTKKSESSVRIVLEHSRDGGANCLLTITPVSCAGLHHIDDGGQPVVLFGDFLILRWIIVV